MEKWADYLISKEKWISGLNTIESFIVHEDNGSTVSNGVQRARSWIVAKLEEGKTFCCIIKGEDGHWNKSSALTLNISGGLKWGISLPLIFPKRKCFISYYHKDDKKYKEKFYNMTSDLITHKSVDEGEIDSDNSADYVKQLINQNYLDDTTVLIILIGPNTKCRKHVDWEISGALNYKVGDRYSGLLGLVLPNHPDFGRKEATFSLMPARLADNFKSEYAIIRDYTADRKKLQEYIEVAFNNRMDKNDKRDNSRIQMTDNICN